MAAEAKQLPANFGAPQRMMTTKPNFLPRQLPRMLALAMNRDMKPSQKRDSFISLAIALLLVGVYALVGHAKL